MDIKSKIRTVPNWPVKGVMFRDITTLIQDPVALRATCDLLCERYQDWEIDKIVGIDARGFIFGSVLSYLLGVGFVPVRKQGKLPSETIAQEYTLEYGSNIVEMHADAINPGEKILVVDDLIATGGTIQAAVKLVEQLGGRVLECAFVIELPDLHGRKRIPDQKVFSLTMFEGE